MNPADPFGLVGQVLDGQFRVDKLVGEGGFSAVYRGHHQGLNEPIAIKCLKLPASLGTSLVDTFVQRFRDESRILYRLSQGNLHIVRSVAAGTTQAPATGALVPYMVLEWLEGRSMQNDFNVRRTVGEKGRSLADVVKLFDTAADGLAYAHAQGVAHRDLNPGNLFLAQTAHGVKMKVLDFGVAKLMHDGALNMGPRAQTIGQIKIFTPAYGAPEQFDDRIGPVGSHSDVYAFALILLEALLDKGVVDGAHIGEFADAACNPHKRPTPRSLGVEVPDEVEVAFARATTLDPKQRWHSAGDFWKSLTIAYKMATERKYEDAARETAPLTMGGIGTAATVERPARDPKDIAIGGRQAAQAAQARTMPLGANTPGLPPGLRSPDGPRPRTPTAIGIPMPANRPAGAPLPNVPHGSSRTLASPGQSPSGLSAPAAPPRMSARPPSSLSHEQPGQPGQHGHPAVGMTPRVPTPAPFPRPGASGSDRPEPPQSARTKVAPISARTAVSPPASPRVAGAPSSARFAAAPARPKVPSDRPVAIEDDEETDEATKVHAPTDEVLRTLALHDAANARTQADAQIAAHRQAQAEAQNAQHAQQQGQAQYGAQAQAPYGHGQQAHGQHGQQGQQAHGQHGHGAYGAHGAPAQPLFEGTGLGEDAAGLEAAARAAAMTPAHGDPQGRPGRVTPIPPSLSGTLMMAPPGRLTPPAMRAAAPGASPPAPAAGPAPTTASMGAYGGPPNPGPPGPPQPSAQHAGGYPGAPPLYQPPQPPQTPQAPNVQNAPNAQAPQNAAASPYGHASSLAPSQQLQTYGVPSQQQAPMYNRPSTEQPFAPASFPQPSGPSSGKPKGLPIVPIAIGLAVLALGGLGLGFMALRGRGGTTTSGGVPSATPSDTAAVSVAADPPPVPSAAPEVSAAPTAVAEVDAAPEPVASASASPSASAAPTAAVATTAAAFTPPPPNPGTATPTPSASASAKPPADPNAFNEGAARSRLAQANGVLVFCKQEGGVTGPGSAAILFGNDGVVTGVTLDAPYAGTKEGNCVAGHFRRAKISAFTGSPQTVRHSFEVPK